MQWIFFPFDIIFLIYNAHKYVSNRYFFSLKFKWFRYLCQIIHLYPSVISPLSLVHYWKKITIKILISISLILLFYHYLWLWVYKDFFNHCFFVFGMILCKACSAFTFHIFPYNYFSSFCNHLKGIWQEKI